MAALPLGAETLHKRLPKSRAQTGSLALCAGVPTPLTVHSCAGSPSPLQPTIFLFTLKPLQGINRFLLSHMSDRWPQRTLRATPDVGYHLTNERPALCSVRSPPKVTQPADKLSSWLTAVVRLLCQPSFRCLQGSQWLAKSLTCVPLLRSSMGVLLT